jgi:hypothetical protein
MHAYLTKEFARLARRSGLTDVGLFEALDRAEDGKIDANLGGGLIKQRVPLPGKGRSGGFRTVIAYRQGERAIFLHVFAKSRQENLNDIELETYRELAKTYLALDDQQLEALVAVRGWRRIEK